jgi:hypothetical protein
MKTAVEKAVNSGADLSGADLSKADLSRADLCEADLSRADLCEADLSGANLYRVNLHAADLSRVNLHGANLHAANLYRANLSEADLSIANLYRVNLSGANLYRANLYRANLSAANLFRADLCEADLCEATNTAKYITTPIYILMDQPGSIHAYKLVTAQNTDTYNGGITYEIGKEYEVNNANTDERVCCAAGINLATLDWCMKEWREGYKILVAEFNAEDIAAIPIGSDGKFRVHRCKIVGEKDLVELGLEQRIPRERGE